MAILLGKRQVQGQSIPLSQTGDDPTTLFEIPPDACWPSHISIDNPHATATVYLKWFEIGSKGTLSSSDHSRRLKPGDGYVWDAPPRNSRLVAIADTSGVTVKIDANWSYISAQEYEGEN